MANTKVSTRTETRDKNKLDKLISKGIDSLLDEVEAGKVDLSVRELKTLDEINSSRVPEGTHFVQCNICLFAANCSYYDPTGVCQFRLGKVNNFQDVVTRLIQLMTIQGNRVMDSLATEKKNKTISKTTSDQIALYAQLAETISNLSISQTQDSVEIRAKGKGLLDRFFKNMIPVQEEGEKPVNITPEKVEDK